MKSGTSRLARRLTLAALAKACLWSSAAMARLGDPGLQQQVLAVMPPQWRANRDTKVSAHPAKFPA